MKLTITVDLDALRNRSPFYFERIRNFATTGQAAPLFFELFQDSSEGRLSMAAVTINLDAPCPPACDPLPLTQGLAKATVPDLNRATAEEEGAVSDTLVRMVKAGDSAGARQRVKALGWPGDTVDEIMAFHGVPWTDPEAARRVERWVIGCEADARYAEAAMEAVSNIDDGPDYAAIETDAGDRIEPVPPSDLFVFATSLTRQAAAYVALKTKGGGGE